MKSPDSFGTLEAQSTFQILLTERVYLLKADTPAEAESWISALKHTQVGREEGRERGKKKEEGVGSEKHVTEIYHTAQTQGISLSGKV